VHIEGRTREGGGTSPQWTTAARLSSAGYTAELEPGHSGRAKPAKATELQAPCVDPPPALLLQLSAVLNK